MKNLALCLMMVMAAYLMSTACSDPVKTASQTLSQVTTATQETQVIYRKLVSDRMLVIAAEQSLLRAEALKAAHCAPTASQPATADPECHKIIAEHRAAYEARKFRLVAAATKLDAATGMVYAALLTAVDVMIVVRDGMKGRLPELAALVAKAVEVGQALLDAYHDLKKSVATY